jgi:acetyl-CoA acetyltransferase
VPQDRTRTNPTGSGISLGHPIGATGAILTVKALYEVRTSLAFEHGSGRIRADRVSMGGVVSADAG